jgi:pyruvate/2-oxoglutarate dehydrogenase complex dihydrolipoamide acyltransferase (E2) component
VIRKLVIPLELGESIEVRLLDWLKNEGDAVAAGDALLEFETDKAVVLVTASQPCVVRRTFIAAGDWMKPGDVVAWVSDSADEPVPDGDPARAEDLMVAFDIT